MIELIKELYDLNIIMIYSLSSSTYKLKSDGDTYILKYIDSKSKLDGIVSRVKTLDLNVFDYIIPNKYGEYVSKFNENMFILTPYYQESSSMDEMKLKLYIESITKLHNKTFYTLNVSNDFFLETFEYIEEKLINTSEQLDKIIESIEKDDYKSPFGWMLILNYAYLRKCMDKSYEYLERFKRKSKEKNSVRMVFSYLNFDLKHIMLNDKKIISIENMKNAPPIFDIVDMVEKCYDSSISLVSVLEEYLNKFSLQVYERSWLLAILYIPLYKFDRVDEIEKIKQLVNTLEYCKCIENIEKYIENKKISD